MFDKLHDLLREFQLTIQYDYQHGMKLCHIKLCANDANLRFILFFKVLSENYAQQVSHNSIKDSHTTQMVAIQNHTLINWKSQELRNCNTFALCLNQTAQLEKKVIRHHQE